MGSLGLDGFSVSHYHFVAFDSQFCFYLFFPVVHMVLASFFSSLLFSVSFTFFSAFTWVLLGFQAIGRMKDGSKRRFSAT